jgi:hypothetical protein
MPFALKVVCRLPFELPVGAVGGSQLELVAVELKYEIGRAR